MGRGHGDVQELNQNLLWRGHRVASNAGNRGRQRESEDLPAEESGSAMRLQSTREEGFGCLFGLIGFLVGPFVLFQLNPPPPDLRCGLPTVAVMMVGTFVGTLAGMVIGMSLSHLLPKQEKKSGDEDR